MAPVDIKNRKWVSFILVATGIFMSTLDSSIVNIALPVIMENLAESASHEPFDWPGAVFLTAALFSVLTLILQVDKWSIASYPFS